MNEIMKYFQKAFYFTVFFIPFSFALNIQHDVDMAFVRVLITGLFTILLFYLLWQGNLLFLNKFKNKTTLFLLSFFVFSALSAFWATNPVWSIRKAVFFATIIPIYFLTIYFVSSKEILEKISRIFILSGFLASLFGILQFLSQFFLSLSSIYNFWAYKASMFLYGQNFGTVIIDNQSWFVNIAGKDYFRAISFFPDPHTFALYLGILIPFSLGYFFYKSKIKDKKNIFYLITMLLALLFTFSRGAYFGFFAALFFITFILFLRFKIRPSKKQIYIGAAILLSGILVVSNTVFGERFISSFSLTEVSNVGRLGIWKTSFVVFEKNPILGAGLGNLPIFFDPTASVKSPINAHNTYLDILSELGIIGLLLFGLIFKDIFKNSFLSGTDKERYLRYGIATSFIWFFVHSFFETSLFSVPVLSALCFLLALAVILKHEFAK